MKVLSLGVGLAISFVLLGKVCFEMTFDRPILVGDPVRVLSERGKVMVSRSFAEKICSVEEIVGRTITNEEMPQLVMTVGGVFEDFPENASMKTDILLSIETYSTGSTQNWLGNDRYMGFVKLSEGIDVERLYPAIRHMQEKHQNIEEVEASGTRISYRLVPISRAHWNYTSARNTVMILSFVTFLLLGISILNYVLLAVSAIVRRSKETAVVRGDVVEQTDKGAQPRNHEHHHPHRLAL